MPSELAPPKLLFRTMKPDEKGAPRCGEKFGHLGVRPKDVTLDADARVLPGNGLSVTPDDVALMHPAILPRAVGGLLEGRDFKIFKISFESIVPPLQCRRDNERHASISPVEPVPLPDFQNMLCRTAPLWEKVS